MLTESNVGKTQHSLGECNTLKELLEEYSAWLSRASHYIF